MQKLELNFVKLNLSFDRLFWILLHCVSRGFQVQTCVKGLIVNERGRSRDPWHTPTRTRTMCFFRSAPLVSFRACLSATPS